MIRKILCCFLACFFIILARIEGATFEAFQTTCQGNDVTESLIDAPAPSIHVLIAPIGRKSLIRMLRSLQPQLGPQDYLTVVFDAKDQDGVYFTAEDYLKEFHCTCSIFMEPVNLGFWGHGIRNKYNQLPGDFVLHADDDDLYTSDAIDTVRKHCTDNTTLYIFKMQYASGATLWVEREIKLSKIGTPMGAIPSFYNSQSIWGYSYGGDFGFYNALQTIVPKIEFVDLVIYIIRPKERKIDGGEGLADPSTASPW